ncbi:MAG: amidohydrolase family protein [Eubacterium sp.]|nr:amidohydrolase family protein [Eubacterium sp.]
MRIIDFHTHTFPDKIVGPALESLRNASNTNTHSDGTVSGLRASMKRAGVDVSIILPVVTNPDKASSMNNYAARMNEDFEKTGVFSLGGIHPLSPDIKSVLKEAKDLGLKGIKLHPDYYDIDFNDIRIKRIIDIASEMGLFIITHAGRDIGLYPPIRCTLDSIIDVLKDVKPETLVLAHMGGWMNWEEVNDRLGTIVKEYNEGFEASESKGVYLDSAFSIGDISWRDDNTDGCHQMSDDMFRKMVKTFGSDRILFATDSPWADQEDYVKRINAMGLSEADLELIYHRNAENILGI